MPLPHKLLLAAICIAALQFAYSAINISRARDLIYACAYNLGKLKRILKSEDELARKDIGMLNVLKVTSLVSFVLSALTAALTLIALIIFSNQ